MCYYCNFLKSGVGRAHAMVAHDMTRPDPWPVLLDVDDSLLISLDRHRRVGHQDHDADEDEDEGHEDGYQMKQIWEVHRPPQLDAQVPGIQDLLTLDNHLATCEDDAKRTRHWGNNPNSRVAELELPDGVVQKGDADGQRGARHPKKCDWSHNIAPCLVGRGKPTFDAFVPGFRNKKFIRQSSCTGASCCLPCYGGKTDKIDNTIIILKAQGPFATTNRCNAAGNF